MALPSWLFIYTLAIMSCGIAYAFLSPQTSRITVLHGISSFSVQKNRHILPSSAKVTLSSSNDDNDTNIASELQAVDEDLAREIDEALSLAKNALTVDGEDGEGAKVTILKKRPPKTKPVENALESLEEEVSPPPPSMPAPPNEDPPDSLLSDLTSSVENTQPLPPKSPPSPNAVSFGETLQKAVADEVDRLKNLLFGLNQDLKETKSRAEDAEEAAAKLKNEIEASRQEREAMVKDIEMQFNAEKELLAAQLSDASEKLQIIIFESEQNITLVQTESSFVEKELLSRIDAFTASIDQVTSEAINANLDKERLQQSKQQRIDKVKEEANNNFLRYKATLDSEGDNIKRYNAELGLKVDAAELRVREVYDGVKKVRSDRVALQQQIQDVESTALEEITILERQMKFDNDYFADYLRDQRAKIDSVLSEAQNKYATILEGEKKKRETIENEFIVELDRRDKDRRGAISAIKSKANARLDELEKKHSKERIAIYQQKIEAVTTVRNQMLAELAIENSKLEAIHAKMEAKISSVHDELAQVQAGFQKELDKRRRIAEEERQELLDRMDDVRSDMTSQMNDQQKMMEARRSTYLEEQNALIAKAEEECRRAWIELANLNKQVDEVGLEKIELLDCVAEQTAQIELYEEERESFRKSLGLSVKLARQKIGSKTKRLIGKEQDKV